MESGCSSFHFYMMRMAMKMAAVSTTSLLLLCCSTIFPTVCTDSQETCDHYAAVGDNSVVPLKYNLGDSQRLKWMYNSRIVFLRRSSTVILDGDKNDIDAKGSLILKNVNKTNQGLYTPEVHSTDGAAVKGLKSVRFCVLDRVPQPKVTAKCQGTNAVFTCKYAQADVKVQWLQNDKEVAKETTQTLTRSSQQVEKASFRCKVSNLVSSMTSAPVTQTCNKPAAVFPDKVLGINTWIIVGAGGGVVLLLIIIVIVCCICTRRKKRKQMKDEGELRLVWTNEQQHHPHQHNHAPDQHHHRHHNHHHQQQPAGHTGPRQHRSKPHREQQRPRAPDQPSSHPQPSPRGPAQAPRPAKKVDDDQPPPLPQPRKKAPKTPRV